MADAAAQAASSSACPRRAPEVRSRPPRGAAAQQLAAQSAELDAAQIIGSYFPEAAQWAAGRTPGDAAGLGRERRPPLSLSPPARADDEQADDLHI